MDSEYDDVPGDYVTVDGIKKRARALDNPDAAEIVERAENRIREKGDGYVIDLPEEDSDFYEMEMFFHLGILTGAAMEREYPSPSGGDADE